MPYPHPVGLANRSMPADMNFYIFPENDCSGSPGEPVGVVLLVLETVILNSEGVV